MRKSQESPQPFLDPRRSENCLNSENSLLQNSPNTKPGALDIYMRINLCVKLPAQPPFIRNYNPFGLNPSFNHHGDSFQNIHQIHLNSQSPNSISVKQSISLCLNENPESQEFSFFNHPSFKENVITERPKPQISSNASTQESTFDVRMNEVKLAALTDSMPTNHQTAEPSYIQQSLFNNEQQLFLSPISSNSSISRLKKIFFDYFFGLPLTFSHEPFTIEETKLIKLFLVKKLIHDTNESKLYQRIISLQPDEVEAFMLTHRPVNRKNVIKMNLFIKIWHVLDEKQGRDFREYYFSELPQSEMSTLFADSNSNKLPQSLKITDQFYSLCFTSHHFREDFFNTLLNAAFKERILQQTKEKFLKNFEFWVVKLCRFLQKNQPTFSERIRVPEIKFGLSEADYDASVALFQKLVRRPKL